MESIDFAALTTLVGVESPGGPWRVDKRRQASQEEQDFLRYLRLSMYFTTRPRLWRKCKGKLAPRRVSLAIPSNISISIFSSLVMCHDDHTIETAIAMFAKARLPVPLQVTYFFLNCILILEYYIFTVELRDRLLRGTATHVGVAAQPPGTRILQRVPHIVRGGIGICDCVRAKTPLVKYTYQRWYRFTLLLFTFHRCFGRCVSF